jgi:hypothetical protein
MIAVTNVTLEWNVGILSRELDARGFSASCGGDCVKKVKSIGIYKFWRIWVAGASEHRSAKNLSTG